MKNCRVRRRARTEERNSIGKPKVMRKTGRLKERERVDGAPAAAAVINSGVTQ